MKFRSHWSKNLNQYGCDLVEEFEGFEVYGHKKNGIKHYYRAYEIDMLLEPSLKVLFIEYGWRATLKS